MALQSSRVLVSFWMCQSIPITSNHRYFEACLEWGSSRNYVHFIGNMMKIPWGFWEYPILGSHIYLAGVKYYRSNDPSYGDVGGHELQREIDRWYNLEDGGFLQPTMWFFSPMEIFGKLEREKFGGFHDKAWDSGLPDVQTVTPLCIRVKLPIFGRCGRINATGICA